MFYIYVLKSLKYGNRYIGSTENVNKRLEEHNKERCRYTSGRCPWNLIYTKKFNERSEAVRREKFLKTGQGRKFLDKILK